MSTRKQKAPFPTHCIGGLGDCSGGGKQVNWIGALGYGGQRLYVVPEMHLVVVIFAGLYANPDLASMIGEALLREHVLAAVAR